MARKRDPKRDEALKIYLENKGNIALVEIAKILDLPAGTIRGWRSKDKWDEHLNGTFQSKNTERSKKSGAPIGNQNAKGNKGNSRASPPKRNKNALKTGEYETIFADYLSDDEKDLYSSMSEDPFLIMSEEIRLLKVRQVRMMKRIAEAEAGLNEKETEKLFELRGRKTLIESKKTGRQIKVDIPDLVLTEQKEKSFRKINDILAIEDALTRVSNQLQKAVKQLSELTISDKRFDLMDVQIKKIKAETNEIGGASTTDEVEDWKQAVIEAANKRAVKEDE